MLAEICTKKSLSFYAETFFKEIMKITRNKYSELSFSNIEMIKRQYSKQATVCLLTGDQKSYITVILMGKKLRIIKRSERPINRYYLTKFYQKRNLLDLL